MWGERIEKALRSGSITAGPEMIVKNMTLSFEVDKLT